jgi:cell division protein FtsI/penicillin-binding protein 2
MKRILWINLLLLAALIAGCGRASGTNTPGSSLPTPEISVTNVPDAASALKAYLEAMKAEDYTAMYTMLSADSQKSISAEDFVKRHKDAYNEMSMQNMNFDVRSTLTNPGSAEVAYGLDYVTALVGELKRDMVASFVLENGQWKLKWDDGLILPELKGGNQLRMSYKIPARGDIYDSSGHAIATQADVFALGIDPGPSLSNPDLYGELLGVASRLSGKSQAEIDQSLTGQQPGWWVPLGEISKDALPYSTEYLNSLGILVREYNSRFYQDSGAASSITGYLAPLTPDNVDQYRRNGYSFGARVGAAGVEKNYESQLGGQRGGTLEVIAPDGTLVKSLAQSDSRPAQSVSLTIDKDLQAQVQKALSTILDTSIDSSVVNGAAVVIERDTGRVLAMASSPGYDPNLFDPDNYNNIQLPAVLGNPNNVLLNRATQGEYPLGSVFKIITMSAALQSGEFTPASTWDCQYLWTEISNFVLHDWTWQHCEDEKLTDPDGKCHTKPSGMLTLPEGLMRSCNPWFAHIGYTLYTVGKTTDIANMARAFGLGSKTGIEIPENAGTIADPNEPIAAVNQSIGQGDVLVTPLQVARFVAAVGNGGTLYRPQLIDKITDVNGQDTQVFKPEAQGTLPVSPDNLKVIQDAMRSVVNNPRGTAYYRLNSMRVPVYGKTGTAETSAGVPHAWFAGYTDANIPGKPDIAVAVVLEYAGEGSKYAAPVFKRIVDSYIYGKPQSIYPWESNYGVPLLPTETPTPTP